MLLSLMSPLEIKTYTIDWLEVNTAVGNFVIQPEHAPTLLVLSPHQPIIFSVNGQQTSLIIPRGIAEITRSSITIFTQPA